MLILNQLTLKNFLSHSETTIQFHAGQKLLIDGKSGAGKSSVIDALIWAFYGEGRSDNRSLLRHGRHEAEVIVVLEDDQTKLRTKIVRTVNEKGKNDLKILQEVEGKFKPIEVSGLRNLQEHLEKNILHSSYLLFVNSIAYPQDNTENFVKQTATKRKEILLEIIRASQYDEYYEAAKEKLNEVKNTIAPLLQEEGLQRSQLALNSTRALAVATLREDVIRHNDTIAELLIQFKDIEGSREKVAGAEAEKAFLIDQETALIVDRATIQQQIYGLEAKLAAPAEDWLGKIEAIKVQLGDATKQLEFLNSERQRALEWKEKMASLITLQPVDEHVEASIKQVEDELRRISASSIPQCKKCGEPYSEYQTEKITRVDAYTKQLTVLNERKVEYDKQKADYQLKMGALGMCPVYDSSVILALESSKKQLEVSLNEMQIKLQASAFDRKGVELELDEKRKKLEEIQLKLIQILTRIELLKTSIAEKQRLDSQLQNLYRQKDDALRQRSTAETELIYAREAEVKCGEIQKRLEEIASQTKKANTDIENLTLLKDAFGPSGIKAMLIDQVIPRLEDRINAILGQLSDFRIRLDTQKSTVDGESTVEGLFINILNDQGQEFEFNNYSGGEKLKIVVAISEALSEIQNFGFRILDEVFTALDSSSTEKFVEAMDTLQSRFSQILCISHLQAIKDTFTERITIVKQDGVSKLML